MEVPVLQAVEVQVQQRVVMGLQVQLEVHAVDLLVQQGVPAVSQVARQEVGREAPLKVSQVVQLEVNWAVPKEVALEVLPGAPAVFQAAQQEVGLVAQQEATEAGLAVLREVDHVAQ